MIDPNEDGITHINIYSKGKTELGRFLSNFACHPFDIEDDGHFRSVEGYWYWLLTKDERLRTLTGYNAKALGKELTKDKSYNTNTRHFQDCIKAAIYVKLNYCKHELKKTDLPFEHYYVYGNKVVDAGHKWILEYIENYRRSI